MSSFPHARGDGPRMKTWKQAEDLFSPRPWGWSDIIFNLTTNGHVFPTPVGMVRSDDPVAPTVNGFPHARGDGPWNVRNSGYAI